MSTLGSQEIPISTSNGSHRTAQASVFLAASALTRACTCRYHFNNPISTYKAPQHSSNRRVLPVADSRQQHRHFTLIRSKAPYTQEYCRFRQGAYVCYCMYLGLRTCLPSGAAQARGLSPLRLSLLVLPAAAQTAQTRLEGLGTYRHPSQLSRQLAL